MIMYALYNCKVKGIENVSEDSSISDDETMEIYYDIKNPEFVGYYSDLKKLEKEAEVLFCYENEKFGNDNFGSFIAKFNTDDTKEIKKVLNGSNNLLVLDNSDEFDLDNTKKYHIATYPSDNTLKAEKILKYSLENDMKNILVNTNIANFRRNSINDYLRDEAERVMGKKIAENVREETEEIIKRNVEIGGIEEVFPEDYRAVMYNLGYDFAKNNMKDDLEYFVNAHFFDNYKDMVVENKKAFSVGRLMEDFIGNCKDQEFLEEINKNIKNYDPKIKNDFFENEIETFQRYKAKIHDILFEENQKMEKNKIEEIESKKKKLDWDKDFN